MNETEKLKEIDRILKDNRERKASGDKLYNYYEKGFNYEIKKMDVKP